MDVLRETFGTSLLGRRVTYNTLPRMNITFNVNTVTFDQDNNPVSELKHEVNYGMAPTATLNRNPPTPANPAAPPGFFKAAGDLFNKAFVPGAGRTPEPPDEPIFKFRRKPNGRFVLKSCKIDAFNIDAGAGKQVVATQWQGVCEEIVSLGGDPPSMMPENSGVYGAYDTIPTRMANTSLPVDDIAAQTRAQTASNVVNQLTRGLFES